MSQRIETSFFLLSFTVMHLCPASSIHLKWQGKRRWRYPRIRTFRFFLSHRAVPALSHVFPCIDASCLPPWLGLLFLRSNIRPATTKSWGVSQYEVLRESPFFVVEPARSSHSQPQGSPQGGVDKKVNESSPPPLPKQKNPFASFHSLSYFPWFAPALSRKLSFSHFPTKFFSCCTSILGIVADRTCLPSASERVNWGRGPQRRERAKVERRKNECEAQERALRLPFMMPTVFYSHSNAPFGNRALRTFLASRFSFGSSSTRP